jgi:lipoate-protein ligase B
VSLLGPTELSEVLALQDRLVAEIAERSDRYGALLLCEHPAGVTIGREGSAADLRSDRCELGARGVPVEWLRRGGGAWAHHGGQLVAYLVAPCQRLGVDAVGLQRRIVVSMTAVAHEFGVPGEESAAPIGVASRCGQFGFVGASLREGVSQFGACLNVSVPRQALQLVRWGTEVRPTCLASARMRPTAMAAVRECWVRQLAAQFGYERYHLATGHPWLRRVERRGVVYVET